MKTIKLFAFCALGLTLLASGCTKEQSELTLSSISGSAVIKGQVRYNQGIKEIGSVMYEEYLTPAVGQTVSIEINYSSYKSGSTGKESFTSVTDEEGNYSISIPVGANDISGTVEVKAFVGTYGQIVNGVTYTNDDAVYQDGNTETFSAVGSGDEKVVNVDITTAPTIPVETLDRSITVYGEATVISESIVLNSFDTFSYVSTTAAELDNVTLLVKLYNNNGSDSRTITYYVDVESGDYEESLPYYDSWDIDDIAVKVTAPKRVITSYDSTSSKFVHYYLEASDTTNPKKQYLTGYYPEVSSITYLSSSSSPLEIKEFELNSIYVNNFTPDNLDSVYGIDLSNQTEYKYSNPMYW